MKTRNCFQSLLRPSVESKWFEKGVKEAIYIQPLNPSLNWARDGEDTTYPHLE